MPLLKLDQACLAFGHVPLLDHVDFLLDKGERVALIGRNGTGKSSFLCALAGQSPLDDGQVWQAPGLRVAYVPQEPPLKVGQTVFEAVALGLEGASQKLAEYAQITRQLESGTQGTSASPHEPLLIRLQEIQHELETEGAWNWQTEVERVLAHFGLCAKTQVGQLSGGQKKCLALAQALVASPEILLLDEPTNHLDIGTIRWLEDLLLEQGATLCFVTHDRQFLERLASRIVELDRGRLMSFPGNFGQYRQRKEAMLQEESVLNRKFDRLLKGEEEWIRKGVEARRTRAVFRVERLRKLRQQREERRERLGLAKIRLVTGDKGGELVAELENVTQSFGEKNIVRDFSIRILRGDKIGLIGPNGIGKTTLLRLILGELMPDSGTVRRGKRLEIAYFDQFREQLNPEASLSEVISPGSDYVEIGGVKKHVTGYLGDFLFAPERARSPVKSLSGGERNRLLLARLFARPANVLVLDEPTNDLDMETLELLEQLLQDYEGTLFLVSHDRVFLDNVVTQVLAAEGGGFWREYAGGYSDWMACQEKQAGEVKTERKTASPKTAPPENRKAKTPDRAGKKGLSWKEQRELEALPEQIAALEKEQQETARLLEDPAFYQNPPETVREKAERLAQIEENLLAALERWESLEREAGG